jgi:hypothetical protein
MTMIETQTYLRCPKDHPNAVPLSQRDSRVGTPCRACGEPLQANPIRERPPPRRYG